MEGEIIGEGKFIKLIQVPHVSSSGKQKNYEIAVRNTASGVSSAAASLLEHTKNETYILIEEYRIPIGRSELGLIAGISDENISTSETIIKEIREEAGRIAHTQKFLTTVASSAGLTNEETDIYHSLTDGEFLGQQLGEDENIKIHEVAISDIDEYLMHASQDLDLRVGSKIDTALRYIRAGKGAKI